MMSAGEASGDQHAANMFLELQRQDPSIKAIGMGAKKMRAAGVEIMYDSTEIGVIGIIEIIRHYRDIQRAMIVMKTLILKHRPDLLICIDYKEFNLRLAQFAKREGIKVLFYVSPQVWASRPKRVVTYGKAIDKMAVIFPFETAYYEAENIPVTYVGHPSVDKVKPLRSKTEAIKLFGLTGDAPIIGLLPGSRLHEIKRMLPVMLETVRTLQKTFPHAQFLLPQADSISDALLMPFLNNSAVKVIKNQPYDAIQCCDAVMTTSGTATLEVALLEIPMVIVYKLSPLTYLLARYLVNIKSIGLPNIVAGKPFIKELIQHHATSDNMSAELLKILKDDVYRQAMQVALKQVSVTLGNGNGSRNMANLVLEMLAV
ncbi:MAG: lipid-A-disaccharide synthase [Methylococcales bacterium]|nr:lipid-A-disaccharide synthase [Methylococcales bacterium]